MVFQMKIHNGTSTTTVCIQIMHLMGLQKYLNQKKMSRNKKHFLLLVDLGLGTLINSSCQTKVSWKRFTLFIRVSLPTYGRTHGRSNTRNMVIFLMGLDQRSAFSH